MSLSVSTNHKSDLGQAQAGTAASGVRRRGHGFPNEWMVALLLALAGSSVPAFAFPAPAWVAGIPVGRWARIPSENSASAVDPKIDEEANPNFPMRPPFNGNSGYAALWGAWNSAGFASKQGPCGSLLYFGGGRDYEGNEVVALNVCGGSEGLPLWERLSDPYVGRPAPPYKDGGYPNRTPVPPNTFDLLQVDEQNNALVLAESFSGPPSNESVPDAWVFDLNLQQWRGPFAHRGARSGVSAYDSRRKLVWFQPQQGQAGELTSFDSATGTFRYFGWPYLWFHGIHDSMMGYDPVRDRLVMTSFHGPVHNLAERQPGSTTSKWIAAIDEGAPTTTAGAHAMAWSPSRRAWIVWMDLTSGAAVYQLAYRATDANGAPIYRWTKLTSASNTVAPINPMVAHNGGYQKFQLVSFDDGSEVLVGQMRVNDGIYAFRVAAGTLSTPKISTGGTGNAQGDGGSVSPAVGEPVGPAPTLDTQAAATAAGHWTAIAADNTARAVDPARDPATNPNYPHNPPYNGASGYGALWEAWNSGAKAPSYGPCGSILYYGGGHTDHWGNEVVALNLCGGSQRGPKWERLNDPYSGPIVWPYAKGAYPNGTPVPVHTYDELSFDPQTNSLVVLQSMVSGPVSTYSPHAWRFNLNSRSWSGPYEHLGSRYGASAYDSQRGLIWFQPGVGSDGQFSSFNPVTTKFSYFGKPFTSGSGNLDSLMGYDPLHDKLVLTSFRLPYDAIAERDPARPTEPWVIAEQRNAPSAKWGQHAFAWSPLRKAWIVWMSQAGDAVYEVHNTGSSATGAPVYTWKALTAATNVVMPIDPTVGHIGPFEKFQIVTTSSGKELLVGQLRLKDGLFAFRVPAPGEEPAAKKEVIAVCGAQNCTPVKFAEPGWADVCASPGMLICDNFSDPKSLDGTLLSGDSTPYLADGKLVFNIPSNSGANAGGNYTVSFPPIGQNRFLAISYRVKANAAAVALPGRKEFTLWRGSAPCTDLELTQTHYYTLPVVTPYTQCGSGHFSIPLASHDLRMQYPDYDCTYTDLHAGNYQRCAYTHADVWENFYIEIQIGTYGQPNSHVVMWHKSDGGVWKRYIERDDFTFVGTGGFDHFMLTVYMTGKNPTVAHEPGQVLYDHLLISTQPFSVDTLLNNH